MVRLLVVLLLTVVAALPARADADLAGELGKLDAAVIAPDSEQGKKLPQMLGASLKARRDDVNTIESKIWRLRIRNKTDWEEYRDSRLKRLRAALGQFPAKAGKISVQVTRTLNGEGYKVDNIVYESRPGLLVTANLYRPAEPPKSMPGIIIIHSHHNPKTQGELQDMGMTWARQGCLVLIPDQLGHGERRQHPFTDKSKYAGKFQPGRQDYYFRYNSSLQLYLIGDSLMGWMVWDTMRGVDVLLAQPGIDAERIILLGSVAGGGDPAAVTAALDKRIAAAAPFNFGGAQPETRYPLPQDAETWFNYAGGGSWESTRNLAFSARDGFLPWVIVGALAPRGLIYAHEFAWDQKRDPVWKRLQKIYGFYDAADHLSSVHGRGSVQGKGPDNTHCNNIGPEHRQAIYPSLRKWFAMPAPEKEYQKRRPAEELQCLAKMKATPLHELAGKLGGERLTAARERRAKLTSAKSRADLRRAWADRLGWVEPTGWKHSEKSAQIGKVRCIRTVLSAEGDIVIPLILLLPEKASAKNKVPVVAGVAQEGKQRFLKERAAAIAELLNQGVAVCLPDVRGTGETRPGSNSRGRTSTATSLSATALMLGQPLLGGRLRDLRAVLAYLRQKPELNGKRLALWGDSFAPVNPPDGNVEVPWDAAKLPDQSEPLGGLLALLAALYEDDVRAVYVRGGLLSFQSMLASPFLYVPHDVIVPGALSAGDLPDVAAALAPRPLRLEALVDGVNRRAAAESLRRAYGFAKDAYDAAAAKQSLQWSTQPSSQAQLAEWLISHAAR